MKFVYADELKKRFNVFGYFYDLRIGGKIFKCRNTLDIVAAEIPGYSALRPDAVVVMMNPGSSRPLDRKYIPKLYTVDEIFAGRWKTESVPTRPDNAQYQIMRVMILRGWKYVKVLNLSDLRNGNSGKFSMDFVNASHKDASHPHCITHGKRRRELRETTRTRFNGPVIAAWGAVQVLRESAESMLRFVPEIIGVRQDPAMPWFRYASPYMKLQKVEWIKDIIAEIERYERIRQKEGA